MGRERVGIPSWSVVVRLRFFQPVDHNPNRPKFRNALGSGTAVAATIGRLSRVLIGFFRNRELLTIPRNAVQRGEFWDNLAAPVYFGCMSEYSTSENERIQEALAGDSTALAELFDKYRSRLRIMINLRIDRRIQGRVGASDVLQESFLDMARRLREHGKKPNIPFFLWLRMTTGQRLAKVHRKHLGAAMRNAGLEVSLHQGQMPAASSFALAAGLMGAFTSASQKAMRGELQLQVQEVLNGLDENDREILALRHFEELSNQEIAIVLNISESAASTRYGRAIRRFQVASSQVPGLLHE